VKVVTAADALAKLERMAMTAIVEMREPMGLTEASHARSTVRRKTKAEHAAERARVLALCEAVALLGNDLTPHGAWYRLENAGVEADECPDCGTSGHRHDSACITLRGNPVAMLNG